MCCMGMTRADLAIIAVLLLVGIGVLTVTAVVLWVVLP